MEGKDKELDDACQEVINRIKVTKSACKYTIGKWRVDEQGLWQIGDLDIDFVKGTQKDATQYRQDGVISEELIALCILNLGFLNQGNFKNEHTDAAIKHLHEALKAIQMRVIDRKRRDVFGTSKK